MTKGKNNKKGSKKKPQKTMKEKKQAKNEKKNKNNENISNLQFNDSLIDTTARKVGFESKLSLALVEVGFKTLSKVKVKARPR